MFLFSMDNFEVLVVDASPFINQSVDLNQKNLLTTSRVISELKDSKTRQLLQRHDIKTREPTQEAINYVVRFSKLTGDYNSLSSADIGIIALTLMVEWELVGKEHLKFEPKSIAPGNTSTAKTGITGEFNAETENVATEGQAPKAKKKRRRPKKPIADQKSEEQEISVDDEETKVDLVTEVAQHFESATSAEQQQETQKCKKLSSFIGNNSIMDIPVPEGELSDSDGGEWITPSTLTLKPTKEQKQTFKVGCITNDFAMQVYFV